MTDEFINELSNYSTMAAGDMLVSEKDPGGTPETVNILWNDFSSLIVDQSSYQIVPSVSSNNLTVAIKDMDGNDATSNKVIKFKVGNTIYTLAAAKSVTAAAGTNWCNLGSAELAAKDTDLFVYVIGQTGTGAGLKLGFSRIPYAKTMADLITGVITNQAFIQSDIVTYNATDPVAVIGRFRARLSAGAGYTWSIPTPVVVNRPIYESDWLAFTPGIRPQSGAFTTLGAVSAQYQVVGRNMHVQFAAGITTNGTGGGAVLCKCPFIFTGMSHYGAGRENNVVGGMLQVITLPGSADVYAITAANAYPGGTGYNVSGSITSAPII